MKKNLCFNAILFLSLVFVMTAGDSISAPAQITSASRIQSVVVYPDRAMIGRTATVPLKQGENIVRLPGITANLIDESVEVSLKNGRIADVKVERSFLTKVSRERMKGLEEKLDEMNGRIKAFSNEVAVVQNTVDFLKKLNPFPAGQKTSLPEIESHVKFIEKSLAENYREIARIEANIRKLNEEKKGIEEEMKRLQSSGEESKSIVVHIVSDREASGEMTTSYVVGGVSWQPLYEVRADTQKSNVEINSFAILKQSTGEDWSGVSLELSTARPSVRGTLPELTAWYVDVYKPRMTYPNLAFDSAKKDYSMALEAKVAEREFQEPRIKTEATAFSFVLPGKMDLPSDNEPHRVWLASETKETKFIYYAVPKISKYAYLKTELRNPFAFSLLSGGINLFVDGRFVSTTSLPKTILPDENMDLSLGIDEAIKIERKPPKKFTESIGTFTKETKENYEFLTEILNGKGKEIVILVKDGFPVSRNEKIKVEMKSPVKGDANIADDGMISWNLKLAPGEKKQLKAVFTVTYPRDLRITGLE